MAFTLEKALALIALKCGNRDIEEMVEYAIPHMQLAQARLEADPFLPWFLKEEVVGEVEDGAVMLPADFLKLDHGSGIWKVEPFEELCLRPMKEALTKYGLGTGEAQEVVLQASKLVLFPKPEDGLNVLYTYFRRAGFLEELADTNLWLQHAPWYITAVAGLEVAEDLEFKAGVQFFTGKVEESRELLFRQNVERESSGERWRF